MTTTTTMVDEARLGELLGRFVNDMGATMQAPLMALGEKLGLFEALMAGPATAAELAGRTGTVERYVREWASSLAAGGYVDYDPATDRFALAPEQALMFDPASPAYVVGGFQVALAAARSADRLEEAFRTGEGIGWHEHDNDVFCGTAKFFGSGYRANLVGAWIPALDGAVERLRTGATVADVGCGHGLSTALMAEAFPASVFVGFDLHEGSLEDARRNAREAGVSDRVDFVRAAAKDYPGGGYDLVTMFDVLHDLGDPVGAARHVLETLAEDGVLMVVEPRAGDRVEDNLNPVGRAFYAGSTMMCTPNALSQEGVRALGAQAGEAALREVLVEAGFTRIRRVAETPFNLVLDARP